MERKGDGVREQRSAMAAEQKNGESQETQGTRGTRRKNDYHCREEKSASLLRRSSPSARNLLEIEQSAPWTGSSPFLDLYYSNKETVYLYV